MTGMFETTNSSEFTAETFQGAYKQIKGKSLLFVIKRSDLER
jgi:hypothetical protein